MATWAACSRFIGIGAEVERVVRVVAGWTRLAVVPGFLVLAACAGGSDTQAEAACREKGYTPGTVGFAECLHPEDATQLKRGQEAWERDTEDIKQ